MIAVSSATRIGVSNFFRLLNISRELVYGLNVDAGLSRIAALTFADQPYIQFQLNTFVRQLDVLNGLSMAYQSVACNVHSHDQYRTTRREACLNVVGRPCCDPRRVKTPYGAAVGQPSRPTQPSTLPGSVNE